MRLDKFLKVSRLIKRRTLAKEVCDEGLITVNGRAAKAGTVVKPGDVISLRLGSRRLTVEVLEVADNVPAKLASSLYSVLSSERIDDNNEF
ncbi:RNA-binding S4 domain-containing protein [Desulforudis sp. 1088]|uniref:RNA-binding S4 domain-containing protein n=1 Tax=unclassified Candidatus Desulforudis TaxID=2635950 RepID=UPI00346F33E6